jgi:uncharacterized lipoprotein YehR (DUF1307 family)
MVFLVGCGKKTLTCEKKESATQYDVTQKYEMTYNKGKIDEGKVIVVFDIKKDYEAQYDQFAEIMDQSFGEYKNIDGITLKSTSNKPKYTVSFTFDFDKIADQSKLDELGLSISKEDLKVSIEDLKKQIEESGATCK